ncbi:UDP-glucose 6-dehydrogenase [Vulcanimicrobium alpinum]|uniref:UDP-glucose 6-dehydrogenase n=1 Tax=Vulcanimicrobium alpinum TaxID=3016050 RepID=A0AAN1XZK5_UNVUL|nr:UDP-glucose/GDP-mannose dehydrogenase family protein [Vulcanimicrobium alpinum]BDE07671.1 UDP-glucose 6-dehydrogenase [Vulcanimicrobium alpinum]
MKSIAIIGAGYVGLVTATCFAELGNDVVCVDNNAAKVAGLEAGEIPFYEPSLAEMVTRNTQAKRLGFTTDISAAVRRAEVIFIAVGTPMRSDGHADLSAVRAVAREIGLALDGPKIVVSKSTVPVETGEMISSIIREHAPGDYAVSVVSNPEFLREGSAVSDFLKPDRVVVGCSDATAEAAMRDLYAPLDAPLVVTDVRTSEMIKYAANAFLATKISFINEIANICELLDVDVRAVCAGIGYDQRIGTKFLNPGIGYGGSCFPKDVRALEQLAVERDYPAPLLHSVELVNRRQVERTVMKFERELGGLNGKTIAVLGLAFKPNTDDVRDAPAIAIIQRLLDRGAKVRAHDPIANAAAAQVLGPNVALHDTMYDAVEGADALLLATEWNEFRSLDFTRCAKAMRGDLILDGRNIFEPEKVRAAGLRYLGVGRVKLRGKGSVVYETPVSYSATQS